MADNNQNLDNPENFFEVVSQDENTTTLRCKIEDQPGIPCNQVIGPTDEFFAHMYHMRDRHPDTWQALQTDGVNNREKELDQPRSLCLIQNLKNLKMTVQPMIGPTEELSICFLT